METRQILRKGMFLFLVGCLFPVSCQKEYILLNDDPDTKPMVYAVSTPATGTIIRAAVNGNYRCGKETDQTNTVTLTMNVTGAGTYQLSTGSSNGITFSGHGFFNSAGIHKVSLTANGRPEKAGSTSFTVTFGNEMKFTVVAVAGKPIVSLSGNSSHIYFEVANHKTGRVWLDRNLGAARVAASAIDFQSYGSLFQWGRPGDGHQVIQWVNPYDGAGLQGISMEMAASVTPGHDQFIAVNNAPWNWRIGLDKKFWQGLSGQNNPCPTGYRIPTETELAEEIESWDSKTLEGAFASSLKWAVAGHREYYNGDVYEAGSSGGVWSSSIADESMAKFMWFSVNEGFLRNDFPAVGHSVRCIKD